MNDLESYVASFDAEPGYLDWAAFGPISPSVRGELQGDAELLGAGRRSSIDLVAENARTATSILGELLDSPDDQVTLQPSTTYGLMHAIYGLTGALMLSRAEFPSLTVAAVRAAAFGAPQVQWLDPIDGFVTPELVSQSLTDQTQALAVSLVDFRTGYRADLSALRDVIGDRLLIVDAIQGFGVIEADYTAADVVCGHGYKWLRAGRGTGFAQFSERAIDRLRPVLSGFVGTDVGLPVDAVPPPSSSASAFTISGADHLATSRLAAALQEVRDVGVGVIESELADRAQKVMFVADRYEVPVITPREPQHRAGIVTLAPEAHDVAPLAASLANHGLIVTARAGHVRVAPHVGTGADTIRLFGDALAGFVFTRSR